MTMVDWAEIRWLHRAEGVPIRGIRTRFGIARNTVWAALASDGLLQYSAGGQAVRLRAPLPQASAEAGSPHVGTA